MTQPVQAKPVQTSRRMGRVILIGALLLVAFLVGFVPTWLQSRDSTANLAQAERQLSLARIENALAASVIDARRADYEAARQELSAFFTSLRTETDKGSASAFSTAQRDALQPMYTRRDEVITLLARSDPAAADQLSELYVSYRKLASK